MTIHDSAGFAPAHDDYRVSEGDAKASRGQEPVSLRTAYARFLATRSVGFEYAEAMTDDELAVVLREGMRALGRVAICPASTIDDFSIKLGLLVCMLESAAVPCEVAALAGSLISDLRRI
jgi:hypothetical protein